VFALVFFEHDSPAGGDVRAGSGDIYERWLGAGDGSPVSTIFSPGEQGGPNGRRREQGFGATVL
jgi:hypothetical protein